MTATAYNNLAATYYGMGKYDKAQRLYDKALKLLEDKLGPNHYKVGAALDNIGVLYREKGEYKKAESYALRAVEITEKARGPDHPETATALNDLAKVYEEMGDKPKAEPLRERAATSEKGKTTAASPSQTASPQATGHHSNSLVSDGRTQLHFSDGITFVALEFASYNILQRKLLSKMSRAGSRSVQKKQ